jgi:mRNA interferase YafQ
MYTVVATNKFKKDFNKCLKRGLKEHLLKEALIFLEKSGKLPEIYRPHKLSGNYKGYWECHIQPDWLLIWKQDDEIKLVSLTRTGTHSDLF